MNSVSKYIIEFEDKPWIVEGGVEYYKCVSAPWWSTSMLLINTLTPYDESEAYAQGYKDALDNAGKIELWDEIRSKDFDEDLTYVVTRISQDGKTCEGICPDGAVYEVLEPKDYIKTGRRFPQLADVLKLMREGT